MRSPVPGKELSLAMVQTGGEQLCSKDPECPGEQEAEHEPAKTPAVPGLCEQKQSQQIEVSDCPPLPSTC